MLRRLLLTPYLSKQDCQVLSQYKYHAAGSTKLDDILNKTWWTPVSEIVPKNIHPNVLTITALLCSFLLSFAPLVFHSPDFKTPCPRIVHLLVAVGFFAYQTLDAIDGKQARRTGLQSPTGQLMDHGCDAVTTILSMFTICATVQLGTGTLATLLIVAMSIQLYLYSWWEVTYGVFRSCTGSYLGVTEGQLAVMGLNIVAMWDPYFWGMPLGYLLPSPIGSFISAITLSIPINTLMYVVGVGLLYYMIYVDFSEILLSNPPKDKEKAIKEWMQMGLQVYCHAALLLGGVVDRHPVCSTLAMSFAGALMAWRLILSCVSKSPLRLIQWPSIPFIVGSIIAACRILPYWLEFLLMLAVCLWSAFALFAFVVVNMGLIRHVMGQNLFSVGTPDTASTQASPMATTACVSPTSE